MAEEVGGPCGNRCDRAAGKGNPAIDILAAADAIARAQGRVWPLLEGLAGSGKLPSSLLFAGPEGSGKELTAVRLAAWLNCETAGSKGACRAGAACAACAKVRSLEHPDVHIIYPVPHGEMDKALPEILAARREDFFGYGEFGYRARSIGIDLVRHVADVLSKLPFEGRRTVVALFEAHLATVEAQNALLKLLEEPPASAVIILVTEYPDRLLPTILSRCSEVRFDPLSAEAIAALLVEFYSVEEHEARRLAALAQGNLRRGIKFLEERFLGLWKDAALAVRLVIDGKANELLAEAEGLAGGREARERSRGYSREEIAEFIEEMMIIFGLLIRHRDGRLAAAERSILEESIGAQRLSAAGTRELAADVRKISSSMRSLRRNADVELTLSQLFLDLTGAWY